MFINIFDFDETITIYHTFQQSFKYSPDTNIKKNVGNFFQHDGHTNISTIATYFDNPDYVKTYIEKILNKKLNLKETIDYEHDKLSIYNADNLAFPIIISTVQPRNYNHSMNQLYPTGKNIQIKHILALLKNEYQIDYNANEVQFFDDSEHNFQQAQLLSHEINSLRCHLIDNQKLNLFSIKQSKHNLEGRRVIDAPQTNLNDSEQYRNNSTISYGNSSSSFFHHADHTKHSSFDQSTSLRTGPINPDTSLEKEYKKRVYLLFKSFPKDHQLYEGILSAAMNFLMLSDFYNLCKGEIEVNKYYEYCRNDQERKTIDFLLQHKDFFEFANFAKEIGMRYEKLTLEHFSRHAIETFIREEREQKQSPQTSLSI